MKALYRNVCLTGSLLVLSHFCFSQTPDSTKTPLRVGGGITITNNGVSLLPTFMLGKPAVMFDLSVGGKRHSFEPQFRFSLKGKPWVLLFWWRYKLIDGKRFRVGIGAHPAIAFKSMLPVNETGSEILVAKRAIAGEVSPNYQLTKHVNVGVYYLTAHGFDPGLSKSTHFLALRGTFSNIRLANKLLLHVSPQLYYLNLDTKGGFYTTSTLTLTKRGFPLSVQSILNKKIQTSIPGRDFIWNVSLIYSFAKNYISS